MSILPSTKRGNKCVFMVIAKFSKMTILSACNKSMIEEATAKLFFEQVWVDIGIPQSIISYQDSRFLSTFLLTL